VTFVLMAGDTGRIADTVVLEQAILRISPE
jgi:hypothetical protein